MTMGPSAARESLRMMGYFRGRRGVRTTAVPGMYTARKWTVFAQLDAARTAARSHYYEGL